MQNKDDDKSQNGSELKSERGCDDDGSVNSERQTRLMFNIPCNEYNKRIAVNTTGNKLSGEWTDTVYKHFHKVFPTCSLVFRYNHVTKVGSRRKNCVYWKGKASCRNPGCVSVTFTIDERPASGQVVPVTAIIIGDCNHSKSKDEETVHKRFLKGSSRHKVANLLSDSRAQPTTVYYDRLSEMNEEELTAGTVHVC